LTAFLSQRTVALLERAFSENCGQLILAEIQKKFSLAIVRSSPHHGSPPHRAPALHSSRHTGSAHKRCATTGKWFAKLNNEHRQHSDRQKGKQSETSRVAAELGFEKSDLI